MDINISSIRGKIDEVDDQLLRLFIERMRLSEQVAEYKKQNSLPVVDRERERKVLADIMDKAGENEKYAYHLFSTLLELSKARQSELCGAPTKVRATVEKALAGEDEVFPQTGTVACQGVEGGNSQQACDKLLPRGRIVYLKSFESVFDAVESGLCRFGVLPIENSSYGSVRSVYELLGRKSFSIVRSTSLCIRHELLVKPGVKLTDITEIYSHEQAIGQCSNFIAKLGKGVSVVTCANTALAAKMVAQSDNRHAAAIASHSCIDLYGLESLSDDIQDSDNNYTRFICITKDPVIYSGSNRISLVISCENKPGALYDILSKLSVQGVNMTKLESSPVTGKDFEFIFYLELDASVRGPGILPMLEELERTCRSFTLLGCYAAV